MNTGFNVSGRAAIFLAGGLIAFAALAAYSNSLTCPFVFDDRPAIVDNATIRHWRPFWNVLTPPASGAGVCGRPLLNLSFAFNYALGGTRVGGYHAFNLILHGCAALILFGVVRRTLLQPPLHERFEAEALPLSAAIATLWTVHPLLTESVTCVVNRSEVLAGMLFLLTLYAFIRGAGSCESQGPGVTRHRWIWFPISVIACLLGMASKEWMVSAPLIVLLYDRTFVAGSFRDAWRRRHGLYLQLAATWILLIFLMVGSRQRNGVAGFGLGVSSWSYVLTQCHAIARYLGLSLWPQTLVFDYGDYLVRSPADVVLQGVGLGVLVALTLIALWRRPVLGFLGSWFFAILAPSSSVVPLISQTIAEHRMYLPLAAVLGLGVTGIYWLLGRRTLVVSLALAVGLAGLTARRNQDYRDEMTLWRDVVAKWPSNSRAHNNLGQMLAQVPGRLPDAIAQYEEALRLNPDYARAHYNLGLAWSQLPGRLNDAIAHYEEALRLEPDLAEAHNNLGVAWSQMPGRSNDAMAEYEAALRLKPDYAEAHNNLGLLWWKLPGRLNDAIAQFGEALRLRPDYPEAHNNLGNAWSQLPGRLNDAIAQYEAALRLKPDNADAHNNLGSALSQLPGRLNDAVAQYEAALQLKPEFAEAHNNLGSVWSQTPGRLNDAIAQYEEALRLKPDYAEAHYNLGLAFSQMPGRLNDAIAEYQEALRLKPDLAPAWHGLGTIWSHLGRLPAAAAAFREELRLSPNDAAAQQALESVLKVLNRP